MPHELRALMRCRALLHCPIIICFVMSVWSHFAGDIHLRYLFVFVKVYCLATDPAASRCTISAAQTNHIALCTRSQLFYRQNFLLLFLSHSAFPFDRAHTFDCVQKEREQKGGKKREPIQNRDTNAAMIPIIINIIFQSLRTKNSIQ